LPVNCNQDLATQILLVETVLLIVGTQEECERRIAEFCDPMMSSIERTVEALRDAASALSSDPLSREYVRQRFAHRASPQRRASDAARSGDVDLRCRARQV
jgi:hypothetical protein